MHNQLLKRIETVKTHISTSSHPSPVPVAPFRQSGTLHSSAKSCESCRPQWSSVIAWLCFASKVIHIFFVGLFSVSLAPTVCNMGVIEYMAGCAFDLKVDRFARYRANLGHFQLLSFLSPPALPLARILAMCTRNIVHRHSLTGFQLFSKRIDSIYRLLRSHTNGDYHLTLVAKALPCILSLYLSVEALVIRLSFINTWDCFCKTESVWLTQCFLRWFFSYWTPWSQWSFWPLGNLVHSGFEYRIDRWAYSVFDYFGYFSADYSFNPAEPNNTCT